MSPDLSKVDEIIGLIESGNIDRIRHLVESGIDLNYKKEPTSSTVLGTAAFYGDPELVAFLLQSGADVNLVEGYECNTPLMAASYHGRSEVVSILLEAGADAQHTNNLGKTALSMMEEAVDIRFKHLAPPVECYKIINMLENTVSERLNDQVDEWHIFKAVYLRELEQIKSLFEANSLCINEQYPNTKNTPLHYAILAGDREIVKFLLNNGVDINAKNADGITPLILATMHQDLELSRVLVDNSADIFITENRFGGNALHHATNKGNLDLVTLMIDSGIDIESKASEGRTPLHIAAFQCDAEIIMYLLEHGANQDILDADGKTPLELAKQFNRSKAILSLFNNYSEISTANNIIDRKKPWWKF